MNGAIAVGTRALVILGYVVGAAESEVMSGQTVGRVSLVLVGAIVAAFLFYMASRGTPGGALVQKVALAASRASVTLLGEGVKAQQQAPRS